MEIDSPSSKCLLSLLFAVVMFCLLNDFCDLILWNLYSFSYVATKISNQLSGELRNRKKFPWMAETKKAKGLCVLRHDFKTARKFATLLVYFLLSKSLRISQKWEFGAFHISPGDAHNPTHVHVAFQIPRNMLELFKAHRDLSILNFPFYNFWLGYHVAQLLSIASGSCDGNVWQVSLEERLSAMVKFKWVQLKTRLLSEVFQGTTRQVE